MQGKDSRVVARDFMASIVVFLVALPLCMGIAIASGAPPAAGIITGILGGLVVGVIGGAPLQVSGPAAGLAVIVWDLVQTYGLPALGLIVLLAGIFQMLAGVLKLGRWFQAVPPSVIFGMLAGIGVLIFASQFHVMVDDKPKGSGIANIVSIPSAIWKGVVPHPDTPHDDAALLGVLTIVVIVVWQALLTSRFSWAKAIPAPLVGILTATIVAQVLRSPVTYVQLPSGLRESIRLPTGDFSLLMNAKVIGAAAALAIVASAETLLCASATDRMHTGPRTRYDREMFAQGVGNALSGLLGGLPMTGVIVRSSANVHAGAKTRLSAILHGAWLLAAVAAVPFALRLVPVSALAALLVFTGYKLVRQDIRALRERGGRFELVVFFATIIGIVAMDLLKGVALGLALAIGKIVWMFTHLRVHLEISEATKTTKVFLEGSATFLRLPELTSALARVPEGHHAEVHFVGVNHVDHASFDALASFEKQHVARGGRVTLNWNQVEFLGTRPNKRSSERPPPDASPATARPASAPLASSAE
jgi:MFS superfamily sulfate permease-like transporter